MPYDSPVTVSYEPSFDVLSKRRFVNLRFSHRLVKNCIFADAYEELLHISFSAKFSTSASGKRASDLNF